MLHAVTATVIRAGQAGARITSHNPAVTEWARRYFGPWWSATDLTHDTPPSPADSPIIGAEVDSEQYHHLTDRVHADPDTQAVVYARGPLDVSRGEDGTLTAASREGVAYCVAPGGRRVQIAGLTELGVNQAAARLARETIRAQLHSHGWTLMHASAVTHDDRAVLTCGGKGAGKTTIALTLAHTGPWALLANDRVFARSTHLGVRLLPWPAAAAIGLGLLDALGWYDIARDRLRAGEHLHPTQHDRVTQALLADHRTPLWEGNRELKAQVFPDQLRDWFDLTLATSGHAAALLFPAIASTNTISTDEQPRGLLDTDFFDTTTEDRYPDIFGLRQTDPEQQRHNRNTVAERLANLPRHAARLGHDTKANSAALAWILAGC
jgi:hypothetical protein